MITIQHDRVYSTYYLHLSRFAEAIRVGERVTQGEIIGYVGSTGRSTGPHLDFRMTKHGKFLNPLGHDTVEAMPLPRHVLPTFQVYARRLLRALGAGEYR
jgi:murein DD-endopeptidase MepM/ murein hydrolase activator NlpD